MDFNTAEMRFYASMFQVPFNSLNGTNLSLLHELYEFDGLALFERIMVKPLTNDLRIQYAANIPDKSRAGIIVAMTRIFYKNYTEHGSALKERTFNADLIDFDNPNISREYVAGYYLTRSFNRIPELRKELAVVKHVIMRPFEDKRYNAQVSKRDIEGFLLLCSLAYGISYMHWHNIPYSLPDFSNANASSIGQVLTRIVNIANLILSCDDPN